MNVMMIRTTLLIIKMIKIRIAIIVRMISMIIVIIVRMMNNVNREDYNDNQLPSS